jgi:hypothetical protein
MLRNFKLFLVIAGTACLGLAPSLHAQSAAGPVRGDVDGDGKVTAADARIIADWLVGKPVPPGASVAERGDVNGDGRVTSVDAAIVAAFVAGRDMSRYGVGQSESQAPSNALAKMVCRGDVRARTVSCDEPQTPAGIRPVIIGGQNVYVKLASSGTAYNAGTGVFSTNVTVQNLVAQALGTTTGVDDDSLRVFFSQEPVATGAGDNGSITVANPSGHNTFLTGNVPYFAYPGPLAQNATTPSVPWQFQMSGTVTTFAFTVYVNANVQYPSGWVDIYPPQHAPSPYNVYSDTMSAGQTLQLTDSVRNAVGKVVPGAPISWSSTGHGAATVNASTGLVTAVADGVDSIIATSGGRTGRVAIVVSTASAAKSTIDAAPATIVAGDSSTITVQIKNSAGVNYSKSAGTVALGVVGNNGTLTAVADHNDGTYTAKYTNTAAGTYTVYGTLNGTAIGDSATVTVTAGAPDSLFVHAANPQTGTAGLPAGSPPGVLVTDKYHNPVQGVTIRFGVTSGGGKLSNGGPAADSVDVVTGSNGIATVTSWTLGNTAGTNNNTVVAHATAVTLLPASVTFTASADPGPPANMVKSAGDNDSTTVGTAVSPNPQVTITDSHGNAVPNVMVHFSVASGNGTVVPDSAATNASGQASVTSWTMPTTSGTYTLSASSTGLTTVTFTAVAKPGAPASLTKTAGDLQNGTAGSAVATAPAVHVADQYGNAVPGVVITFSTSGGGGSVTGGTVATNASGNATVGSWTLGSGPTTNQLGASANPAGTTSPVTFVAYIPPVATTDSSQAMGNTTLSSAIAPNVLTNDVTINGGTIALSTPTGSPQTTVRGGSVTFNANGTLSYLPAAGVTGRDSISYTISDGKYTGPVTSSGWLKFRFIGKVWYVDSSVGSNGDGRDISPFTSVANAEASAGANDSILVKTGGATTAGGTLKAGQTLRGQGHNAAFTASINGNSVTLLGTGTAPNVGTLVLNSGNSLRGIRVFATAGGGITGTSVGTLSVGEISIGVTGGAAIDIASGTITGNGGTGAAVFDSVRSDNSTSTGIALSSVAGTLTINGGTASRVTNPVGSAVSISGSNPTFSFPGTISKTNAAGTGINLSSMTGGTVTFSGPSVVLSTGSGTGINMSSSSATVTFNDSVKVTTTSGTGINATGGGTLVINGTHNSIKVTAGSGSTVGLNVSSTTIGVGGLNFRSIDAAGGANGIVLSSTGTTAGLTVTGDGTGAKNGSGGTISGMAGSDGAVAGNGVYLNGARAVTLKSMNLHDFGGNGIYATGVRGGLTMAGLNFSGNSGDNTAGPFYESAIQLVDIGGPVTLTGSNVQGGFNDNLKVDNSLGTAPALDSLVVTSNTFGALQGTGANPGNTAFGINIQDGSAKVRVRNNSFSYWWNDGFQMIMQSTATTGDLIFSNNQLNNTNPGNCCGSAGIALSTAGNTTNFTFKVTGNSVKGAYGAAISSTKGLGTSTLVGTFQNDTVGTAGVLGSGSVQGTAITVISVGGGTHTVLIDSNQLHGFEGSQGIILQNGDNTSGGSGTLNATVTNNLLTNEGASTTTNGISGRNGTTAGDAHQACFKITGNNLNGVTSTSTSKIRLSEGSTVVGAVTHIPGYPATDAGGSVATYLPPLNNSAAALGSGPANSFANTAGGAACPTPP